MNQHIESKFDLRTAQGIFDHVSAAIIAQGKASYSEAIFGADDDYIDGGCRYRAADGCKCAAGHLIPDDLYNPSMENTIVSDDDDKESPFMQHFDPRVRRFANLISHLQSAHDSASVEEPELFMESYREEMAEVAYRFGLKTDVLLAA